MKEQKKIFKLEIIVVIQGNIEVLNICNLKFSVPKNIPIAFYNGSNCHYNFIIRVSRIIYLFRRKQ